MKMFKFNVSIPETMLQRMTEPIIVSGENIDEAHIRAMEMLERNAQRFVPYVMKHTGVEVRIQEVDPEAP